MPLNPEHKEILQQLENEIWVVLAQTPSLTDLFNDLRERRHIFLREGFEQAQSLKDLFYAEGEFLYLSDDNGNIIGIKISYIGINKIPKTLLNLKEKLRYLNLSDNQISDLGPLKNLKNLTDLNLSDNQISDLGPFKDLKNLKKLYLWSNQIRDLGPLKDLKNLKKLYLWSNQIRDLGPFKDLKNLRELDLEKNQIRDLGPLKELKNLIWLNLGDNQISDLRPLKELKNLTELYLGRNQISDLSPLNDLKNLRELDLEKNRISDLSPLNDLKNLTWLNLSENRISDLSPLKDLKNLTELNLSENQISDLGPLKDLKNLTKLDLSENQISDLGPLKDLKNLTKLSLSVNHISDLSPLKDLKNLTVLDLRENQISELPEWITDWNLNIIVKDTLFLGGIHLYKNPLEKPPLEIVNQGKEAIKKWFAELKKKTVEIQDIKVILMGNSTVGKTTLVNYILNTEKNPIPKEGSTHGIKIRDWPPKELNGKTIYFWDFGGQYFYHATHKYFLSEESIYLLLWEEATNKNLENQGEVFFDIDYWIKNIRHFAPQKHKAPILLVQNKAFRYEDDVLKDFSKQKNYPEIEKSFSISVLETYQISKKTNKNIRERKVLQNFENFKLELLSLAEEKMKNKVPGYWEDLREKIKQARKKGEKYWTYEYYQEVAKKIDLNIELELCTSYLINRGEILYYPDITSLKDKVFLSPKDIANDIYKILQRNLIQNNAEFSLSELKNELSNELITEQKIDEYIALMQAPGFELIFKKPGNNDIYIAPQYLSENMPEHIKEDILPGKELAFGLQFIYFMPRYLPVRFLSRYGIYSGVEVEKRNYWKYGAFLKIPVQGRDEIIKVVVNTCLREKKIEIWTDEQYRKSHIIKEIYKQLLDIVSGEENKDKILLYFSIDENKQPIDAAPINVWAKNIEVNIFKIELPKIVLENNVIDLQEYRDLITARPIHQQTQIFISYAGKDFSIVEKVKNDLEFIFNDKIKIWFDMRDINYKWNVEIKEAVEGCDIFIIFLSDNLCARGHYALEKELPIAIKENKHIIPVLISDCRWKILSIRDIQIIPDQAKPIKKYNDEDTWKEDVVNKLEKIIKDYRRIQGLE